jgi:putative hydrolase of HD superfamily
MVNDLLKFLDLMHELQLVKRAVLARAEDRYENDLEHSYLLAMLAWYVSRKGFPELNVDRILRYALAHDVVEAYAGDTPLYSGNREEQRERETKARQKLRETFPEFPELHQAIDEYEARENREAKFVFALDKLLPVLINYQDGGRNWKPHGITLETLILRKAGDISVSPEVQPLFDGILECLRAQESSLFGGKGS